MSQKRKICVATGTRAEYGIMSRLIKSLKDDDRVDLQVVATNMHLSPEFGMTVREIEADGIRVDRKVEMLLSSDTPTGTVKSMGLAMIGFADAFAGLDPDLVVILGDRSEMLAVASAAAVFGIPIAHLHGGEITEGAYDDCIRHAISKMSYLHFASTEEYRRRIIQMGESPDRVFNVGALGVDNILSEEIMPLSELEGSLGFPLGDRYLLVTYHPVTREPGQACGQIDSLLEALESVKDDYKILFTLPNSDTDGRVIASRIREWAVQYGDRVKAVQSLGHKRYYSALKHASALVGNSSSGIIEAPSFRVPTLNIGNRQKGRVRGNTVVDCGVATDDIKAGLQRVLNPDFLEYVKSNGINPYYQPDTLQAIKSKLVEAPVARHSAKPFYNLPTL